METHDISPAIAVENVGVRYSLRLHGPRTLRERVTRPVRRRASEFWAVRNASFIVKPGESVGIIGANGAGKSTLLQVMAGILRPDEGRSVTRGRVSTLLTMGPGFDPDLSGRENIALAGAFMGIGRAQMRQRMERIIAFAELGQFIDAPLKTYSAGMRARLGFSIAASIEPEVLLLDEVLGAGDANFKAKSQARIRELVAGSGTVVMATHGLNWIEEFAERSLLMEKGQVINFGPTAEIVRQYREMIRATKAASPSIWT